MISFYSHSYGTVLVAALSGRKAEKGGAVSLLLHPVTEALTARYIEKMLQYNTVRNVLSFLVIMDVVSSLPQ